jgi:hypothetical protein
MDQRRRPRFGADSETGGDITTDADRKAVSLHRGRGLSKTLGFKRQSAEGSHFSEHLCTERLVLVLTSCFVAPLERGLRYLKTVLASAFSYLAIKVPYCADSKEVQCESPHATARRTYR